MTTDETLGPKGIDVASYGGLTLSDFKTIKKGCGTTLSIQLQRAANRLNWALALSANTRPWTERYTEFLRDERFVAKEGGHVDQDGRLWTKYEVMTPQEKNVFDSFDHFAQIMELADAERRLHSGGDGRKPEFPPEEIEKSVSRVIANNPRERLLRNTIGWIAQRVKDDWEREHRATAPSEATIRPYISAALPAHPRLRKARNREA